MKSHINPVISFLKSHYNNTKGYEIYNMETKQFEMITYTEPLKHIIFSDVFAVGVLYCILYHL
tara:strand:+ start:451 stop:639 length:189 start_codon:yes stop_codon:yes gene_type:complete